MDAPTRVRAAAHGRSDQRRALRALPPLRARTRGRGPTRSRRPSTGAVDSTASVTRSQPARVGCAAARGSCPRPGQVRRRGDHCCTSPTSSRAAFAAAARPRLRASAGQSPRPPPARRRRTPPAGAGGVAPQALPERAERLRGRAHGALQGVHPGLQRGDAEPRGHPRAAPAACTETCAVMVSPESLIAVTATRSPDRSRRSTRGWTTRSRRGCPTTRGRGRRRRRGYVVLEVAQAVGLHERDLVVVLVRVVRLALVDVPDEQPAAGSSASKPVRWRFSTQEVLLRRRRRPSRAGSTVRRS